MLNTAKGGTCGHLASIDLEKGIAIGIPRVKARKLWRKLAGSIVTSHDWWEGVLPASSSFLCPNTKKPFENPVLILATGVTVEGSTFIEPSDEIGSNSSVERSSGSHNEVECLRQRVKELELEVSRLKSLKSVPNLAMKSAVLEVKSLLKTQIQNNKIEPGNQSHEDAAQRHMQSELHTPTVGKERVGHLLQRMSSAFKYNPESDGGTHRLTQEICSAEFMNKLEGKSVDQDKSGVFQEGQPTQLKSQTMET